MLYMSLFAKLPTQRAFSPPKGFAESTKRARQGTMNQQKEPDKEQNLATIYHLQVGVGMLCSVTACLWSKSYNRQMNV